MANNTGLRPFLWGVPVLARKEWCSIAPLTFIFIFVLLSRNLTILRSFSSMIVSRMSCNCVRFMVSNAADISIPVMLTFNSCVIEHVAFRHHLYLYFHVFRTGCYGNWLFHVPVVVCCIGRVLQGCHLDLLLGCCWAFWSISGFQVVWLGC